MIASPGSQSSRSNSPASPVVTPSTGVAMEQDPHIYDYSSKSHSKHENTTAVDHEPADHDSAKRDYDSSKLEHKLARSTALVLFVPEHVTVFCATVPLPTSSGDNNPNQKSPPAEPSENADAAKGYYGNRLPVGMPPHGLLGTPPPAHMGYPTSMVIDKSGGVHSFPFGAPSGESYIPGVGMMPLYPSPAALLSSAAASNFGRAAFAGNPMGMFNPALSPLHSPSGTPITPLPSRADLAGFKNASIVSLPSSAAFLTGQLAFAQGVSGASAVFGGRCPSSMAASIPSTSSFNNGQPSTCEFTRVINRPLAFAQGVSGASAVFGGRCPSSMAASIPSTSSFNNGQPSTCEFTRVINRPLAFAQGVSGASAVFGGRCPSSMAASIPSTSSFNNGQPSTCEFTRVINRPLAFAQGVSGASAVFGGRCPSSMAASIPSTSSFNNGQPSTCEFTRVINRPLAFAQGVSGASAVFGGRCPSSMAASIPSTSSFNNGQPSTCEFTRVINRPLAFAQGVSGASAVFGGRCPSSMAASIPSTSSFNNGQPSTCEFTRVINRPLAFAQGVSGASAVFGGRCPSSMAASIPSTSSFNNGQPSTCEFTRVINRPLAFAQGVSGASAVFGGRCPSSMAASIPSTSSFNNGQPSTCEFTRVINRPLAFAQGVSGASAVFGGRCPSSMAASIPSTSSFNNGQPSTCEFTRVINRPLAFAQGVAGASAVFGGRCPSSMAASIPSTSSFNNGQPSTCEFTRVINRPLAFAQGVSGASAVFGGRCPSSMAASIPSTSSFNNGQPSTSAAAAAEQAAERERKREKLNHVKKPLNAFMLYMKEMRPVVMAEVGLKERQSAEINRILGRRWHDLSKDEQQKYYEQAREARAKHIQDNPGWSARDNYAINKKKRKKRDKNQNNMELKKCRARFGVDQQEKWCKHCRRKKKCLMFREEGQAAREFSINSDGPASNDSLRDEMDADEDDAHELIDDMVKSEDSPGSGQVSSTTQDEYSNGRAGSGSGSSTGIPLPGTTGLKLGTTGIPGLTPSAPPSGFTMNGLMPGKSPITIKGEPLPASGPNHGKSPGMAGLGMPITTAGSQSFAPHASAFLAAAMSHHAGRLPHAAPSSVGTFSSAPQSSPHHVVSSTTTPGGLGPVGGVPSPADSGPASAASSLSCGASGSSSDAGGRSPASSIGPDNILSPPAAHQTHLPPPPPSLHRPPVDHSIAHLTMKTPSVAPYHRPPHPSGLLSATGH